MKFTGILLLAGALHVTAASVAQQVTYQGKGVPLTKVFSVIKEQTGYLFFYSPDELKLATPVTCDWRDLPVGQVLENLFLSQPLSYEVEGTTVVVSRRVGVERVPVVRDTVPAGKVIHGRVIADSTGEPLLGASVQVKGSGKGTTTDKDGQFELKNVASNVVIIVSFAGHESKEIRLGGKSSITVTLKHKETSLLEFVVSKGYYSTTEKLNTGDATTVKAEVIGEQPVTDPMLALEGRVPGLYIQQTSGIPGAYSTIRIMGQNSIANGNDPLYIVDGVPYSSKSLTTDLMNGGAVGNPLTSQPNGTGLGLSPFNALNPDDIESITVLKDADATAIYGSRGANGVVLIYTKHGKAGSTKVDVNVYTGVSQVTRKMQLLNTQQYLEMRHEAFRNDGLSPKSTDYDINGVWDTTRYTNWQKALISNPAHFSNAQLNISGGNANTQFVAGGGYSFQGMVYPGNNSDKKASAHFNLTHASDNQRFRLALSGIFTTDDNSIPGLDLTKDVVLPPDAPALYKADGTLNWQVYSGTATWGSGTDSNPLQYLFEQSFSYGTNLMGSLNLDYELFPGLQLKDNMGYTMAQMNQTQLYPAVEAAAPPGNVSADSYNESSVSLYKNWIIEPQLSYQRHIAAGSFDALIGSTFQQDVRSSTSQYASGFTSDALINNPMNASFYELVGNEYTLYHYSALYGRIAYNWQDKYLVNLTARRDGSSRFGDSKRFGNFGAVGLGWIFSNEPFVKDGFTWLSIGKLRASYGLTGNDQISDYQFLSTYMTNSSTYAGITGLYPSRIANPYYGWEVVKKLQFGLDLGFLKERILVSGVYYRNRDGNQLVGYPLPLVTGFSSVIANFPALVQNSGAEITLSTINIKTSNFSWSTSLNLTVPTNKLISFPNIQNTSYANTYKVGQSLYGKFLLSYSGVNPRNGVYSFYSAKYKTDTTHPSYPADEVYSKPITQSYYGGLSNKFTYKGFQLDVFLQFVKQLGDNYVVSFAAPGTSGKNEPVAVLSRWQQPGDITNIGRFSTISAANPYGYLGQSNYILSDASFIRLKNVALSYQLPAFWVKRARLQNVRIYFQAQNLLTFTKYAGMDPETGGLNLPPLRTITGGIQVNL